MLRATALFGVGAALASEHVVLSFQRDLHTCDTEFDTAVDGSSNTMMIFAFHASNPSNNNPLLIPMHQSTDRGTAAVELHASSVDHVDCSSYEKPSDRDYSEVSTLDSFDVDDWEYSQVLDPATGVVTLYWNVHTRGGPQEVDVLEMAVVAPITGWLAVGFPKSEPWGMTDADMMIGWFDAEEGQGYLHDRYSYGYAVPPVDDSHDLFDMAVGLVDIVAPPTTAPTLDLSTPAPIPDDDLVEPPRWENWGGGIRNLGQFSNATITKDNVHLLEELWTFTPQGSISGSATFSHDLIYFNDWAGYLHCITQADGYLVWRTKISDYDPSLDPGTFSRTAPVIVDESVVVATHRPGPCRLLRLNRLNGELEWISDDLCEPWELDAYAQLTMSPTYYDGGIFVGTSSYEEAFSTNPLYRCCKFIGRFYRIDFDTGKADWEFVTLPENNGATNQYSGNAIWGSSPSVSPERNAVYFATGNNYNVPRSVIQCMEDGIGPHDPDCVEEDNHVDAIISLDLTTGEVLWSHKLAGLDAYNFACESPILGFNCPNLSDGSHGEDQDFGHAPALVRSEEHGEIVVACSKAAVCFALSADDGTLLWSTKYGRGEWNGGAMWGVAVDEELQMLYVGNNNYLSESILLPQEEPHTGGYWSGIDVNTGNVTWSAINPNYMFGDPNSTYAGADGPVTAANGMVFLGSGDWDGHVMALDGRTGETLWEGEPMGAYVNFRAAVIGSRVYYGSGYANGKVPGNDNRAFRCYGVPEEE